MTTEELLSAQDETGRWLCCMVTISRNRFDTPAQSKITVRLGGRDSRPAPFVVGPTHDDLPV